METFWHLHNQFFDRFGFFACFCIFFFLKPTEVDHATKIKARNQDDLRLFSEFLMTMIFFVFDWAKKKRTWGMGSYASNTLFTLDHKAKKHIFFLFVSSFRLLCANHV